MKRVFKWLGNNGLKIFVLSILLIIGGGVFGIDSLTILGLAPFAIFLPIVFFAVIATFIEGILPDFQGRWVVSLAVALLLTIIVIFIGATGGLGEESGVNFRGVNI